jgi:hypothetical protein
MDEVILIVGRMFDQPHRPDKRAMRKISDRDSPAHVRTGAPSMGIAAAADAAAHDPRRPGVG